MRGLGVGLVIASLAAGEAMAQYGPRANPITGLRTGMRYQPALASPFATTRVGGLGTSVGLSRYGGFYGSALGPGFGTLYGPGFGVNRYASTSFRSGWGLGGFGIGGLGVRSVGYSSVGFGLPVATSFSLNIGGVGYPGYGGWGLGYPTYSYGYGSPWIGGGYPYGTIGVRRITYGVSYPYGSIGYGGFPYGYGYGYGGGYFGY
ncbi:hypothetical protein [Tautonia rosea]|uniref:hypothetical protein n=1 Tax=Tautonia rosea TaxID=2728037 RepID=UPI001475E615|nr:hypothetical protein [Tautonia rosea]